MSRYSKELEAYHVERVRGVMTVRPNATGSEIVRFLEKSNTPLSLHPSYVRKLQKKVVGERMHRARNININLRIAEIQDKKRLIDERLWDESNDKTNPGVVRVMALQQLLKNEEIILKMEMDSGFIDRKLGTVEVNHIRRLSPEQMEAIVATMKLWGIVKDQPEPIQVTAQTYTLPPKPDQISPPNETPPLSNPVTATSLGSLGESGLS